MAFITHSRRIGLDSSCHHYSDTYTLWYCSNGRCSSCSCQQSICQHGWSDSSQATYSTIWPTTSYITRIHPTDRISRWWSCTTCSTTTRTAKRASESRTNFGIEFSIPKLPTTIALTDVVPTYPSYRWNRSRVPKFTLACQISSFFLRPKKIKPLDYSELTMG